MTMTNTPRGDISFRRTRWLPLYGIIAVAAGAAAIIAAAPGRYAAVVVLLACLVALLQYSGGALVFARDGTLNGLSPEEVRECRFHVIKSRGVAGLYIDVFALYKKDTDPRFRWRPDQVVTTRGWSPTERRALFSNLARWLAAGGVVLDPETQAQLSKLLI